MEERGEWKRERERAKTIEEKERMFEDQVKGDEGKKTIGINKTKEKEKCNVNNTMNEEMNLSHEPRLNQFVEGSVLMAEGLKIVHCDVVVSGFKL